MREDVRLHAAFAAQESHRVPRQRCETPNQVVAQISCCHLMQSGGGRSTRIDRARWRKISSLQDEPGLDRLAEPDVVGNQRSLHARHPERANDEVELDSLQW